MQTVPFSLGSMHWVDWDLKFMRSVLLKVNFSFLFTKKLEFQVITCSFLD